MAEKKYRVIQWATGVVGKAALKHFIQNPVIDLVGVLVFNPDKVGKDAGELVGLPATGVLATDDQEAIIALEADAVLFAPLHADTAKNLDDICRLLASGKNVLSTAGPFLPNKWFPEVAEKIEAACRAGNSSFHGCGVHPGFSGDILPITLIRLMDRIDRIEVTEIIDKVRNPMIYTEMAGFGLDPEYLLANPRRSPETYKAFYSSMDMIARSLGKEIEKVTVEFEVAKAKRDIAHEFGLVKEGTVGGQHYAWTAWSEGAPLIVYHFYWQLGDSAESLDPLWEEGESAYRVRIVGDPGLEVRLTGLEAEDGRKPFHGLPWTGLLGATAVQAVVDAPAGVVSHLDLGIVRPLGMVRR
ncbi:MAG: NAD(P)H-dependent amine dehydrogenase family protein [Novosphingobium sp.]